jgi:hypothetical protein
MGTLELRLRQEVCITADARLHCIVLPALTKHQSYYYIQKTAPPQLSCSHLISSSRPSISPFYSPVGVQGLSGWNITLGQTAERALHVREPSLTWEV